MDFISVVSKVVPKSLKVFESMGIPYACTVSPNMEVQLPQVQFPRNSIPRCLYCKGFISLYCNIYLEEKTWQCALCTYTNTFSEAYFQIYHPSRTELSLLNYEFFAEEPNMKRAPMCPHYTFLLDISKDSCESGFLHSICTSLLNLLPNLNLIPEERTQFTFILYDKSVHFISLGPRPQIHTVSESESDLYLPIPQDFLHINVLENLTFIETTLNIIKNLKGQDNSNGLKKAITASQLVMENNGGKILVFICNSNLEIAHPKHLLLMATTDFYHEIGQEFVEDNIGCDIFVTANAYCGLFTLGELAKITGGDVYFYENFDREKNHEHLEADVKRSVLSRKAWEACLRLRISQDWKILLRYGHFFLKKDLILWPCISKTSVTYDMCPRYNENTEAYLNFQASLLYTSSEGVRLVRVMNYQVSVDESIENFLKSISCNDIVNLLMKHSLGLVLKRHVLLSAQKFLESKAVDILKVCLVVFRSLPPNLKNFLFHILGLIKHTIFVNTSLPCKSK